jgi:molybdopterin-guanine dinucleotide biosynthesis protein
MNEHSPAPLGVIRAGGAARRFGGPKALAEVGGARLVERVRAALAGATDAVVVCGTVVTEGVETLPDERPGLGPLGGVLRGLLRAREEGRPGVLAAGCDMPFVSPVLLRLLRRRGVASGAAAVVPWSPGRRGFEPLCAWYGVGAIPPLEAMADGGTVALHRLRERARVDVVPAEEVREIGDPARLFFNVNTMDDLREARRLAATPPAVSVVGRKNSGKTTLVVALLAELGRRGWRVASIKHGHHAFETDQPGRDSWRHFHDGGAAATMMVGAGKVALTLRVDGEPDPAELVRRFYAGAGYDLVLIEGYKAGPFPKVEVFRRALHDAPLLAGAAVPSDWLALVGDDPALPAEVPVVPFSPDGAHVVRLADMLEHEFLPPRPAHGG